MNPSTSMPPPPPRFPVNSHIDQNTQMPYAGPSVQVPTGFNPHYEQYIHPAPTQQQPQYDDALHHHQQEHHDNLDEEMSDAMLFGPISPPAGVSPTRWYSDDFLYPTDWTGDISPPAGVSPTSWYANELNVDPAWLYPQQHDQHGTHLPSHGQHYQEAGPSEQHNQEQPEDQYQKLESDDDIDASGHQADEYNYENQPDTNAEESDQEDDEGNYEHQHDTTEEVEEDRRSTPVRSPPRRDRKSEKRDRRRHRSSSSSGSGSRQDPTALKLEELWNAADLDHRNLRPGKLAVEIMRIRIHFQLTPHLEELIEKKVRAIMDRKEWTIVNDRMHRLHELMKIIRNNRDNRKIVVDKRPEVLQRQKEIDLDNALEMLYTPLRHDQIPQEIKEKLKNLRDVKQSSCAKDDFRRFLATKNLKIDTISAHEIEKKMDEFQPTEYQLQSYDGSHGKFIRSLLLYFQRVRTVPKHLRERMEETAEMYEQAEAKAAEDARAAQAAQAALASSSRSREHSRRRSQRYD